MNYDVIVIGAGPGGYVAAIRCAQLGLKTACIEKSKTLGGTCLNVGCIPSKALLHSSERYWDTQKHLSEQGILVDGVRLDFLQMMRRKETIISGFTQGIEGLFKKNKVEWIQGEAHLKGGYFVEVAGQTFESRFFILATGSASIGLPFLPFDEKRVLSSTGALALKEVPQKLLIIGAGVIGVELGSVYQRLGSEVQFIEFLDRICPGFDLALSKGLQKSLTNQGMVFHLSHKVIKAEIGAAISLTAQGEGKTSVFTADAVLVAIGRKPYSANLGLEIAGIQTTPKGFVAIDASFRTSQPHVFAIGDLVEGPMLAHKASEEGIAVAELIGGHCPTLDYFSIPGVAYTHPEAASVGLTEEEIKTRGISYKSALFPMKANSRARCIGEEEGFVKILADAATHRLLGVHILAANASELIAEATLALKERFTADQLAETCHAHPTLSEAIKEAALALFKEPIHL